MFFWVRGQVASPPQDNTDTQSYTLSISIFKRIEILEAQVETLEAQVDTRVLETAPLCAAQFTSSFAYFLQNNLKLCLIFLLYIC